MSVDSDSSGEAAKDGESPTASEGNARRVDANPREVAAAESHHPGAIQESSSKAATANAAAPGVVGSAGPGLLSDDVVAPAPFVPEIPEAFERLKAYAEGRGVKAAIDSDPPPSVSLDFKSGRDTRTVLIFAEENAEALVRYPLDEIIFLGGYAAVCSYKGGWIEAGVRPHGGTAGRSFIARRNLFGAALGAGERGQIEIREAPDTGGPTLRLTEEPGILSALDMSPLFALRVEGIGVTEHDKAVSLLEEVANSLFMQIDFRFDSPLSLVRSRQPVRRSARLRGRLDQDNQIIYPRHSYERTPSSLYWYARSATSMPLLQFLAFYQCIEFFFPQFSRQETIAKIKNVLKDPGFTWTNDSDINVILNVTLDGRRGSLVDERKQLRATLGHSVDAVGLLLFLNQTDERKKYFGSDFKKISEKRISLSSEEDVVEQTSERIYDIRCKVVHTKNMDGSEREEMILPFSKEADLMFEDVELIKFLARKVLIASSTPLKL